MSTFGIPCNGKDHTLAELPFLAFHKTTRTTVIISQAVFPSALHDLHCRAIRVKRFDQEVKFQTSRLFLTVEIPDADRDPDLGNLQE